MAWKPKLATAVEQVKNGPKPWVAVAEEHAEEAVRLFIQIMKNPKESTRHRLEAATRLVMLAGATFRGERQDAQGRPAANLPGRTASRLESGALKEVLRQLPPGSVTVHPAHTQPGEAVVVLHDGNHSRAQAGDTVQAVVGKLIEQPAEAPQVVTPQEKEAAAKEYVNRKRTLVEQRKKSMESTGPAMDALKGLLGKK